MKRLLLASAIGLVGSVAHISPSRSQIVCANCAEEFTQVFVWLQKLVNDAKDLGLSDVRNSTLGDTLSSLTGVRDPGSALTAMRSLGIQDPLPPQAQQVVSAISGMSNGYSGPDATLGQIIAQARGLQATRDLAQQLYNSQAQGLQQLNGARDRLATAGDPAEKADVQNHIQLATSDGMRQNTQGGSLGTLALLQPRINAHNSEMLTRKDVCDYINYLRGNENGPVPNKDCSQYPLIDTNPVATASSNGGTYPSVGVQTVLYRPAAPGANPMQQMMNQSWGQQAADNATMLGVNPTALAATCSIESNCQPSAVSPTGPTGAWQMAGGTYQADINQVAQTHPDLASQLGGGRADPIAQSLAASQELANNARQLQQAGVDTPTVLDARGAYQFGAGYGVQLARADPSTPMSSIVPSSALGPNGASGLTVGQWRQTVANKLGESANAPILLPSNT